MRKAELKVMKEFKITELELHGTSFIENAELLCSETAVGESVVFCPEPNNPFDLNAVAVKKENGALLGYIPREEAPFVCMLLKSNQRLIGRVSKVNAASGHERITLTLTGEKLY